MVNKIKKGFARYNSHCRTKILNLIQSKNICHIEEFTLRLAGVSPHQREFRDHIDWLYLGLWMGSVIYQWLLFICFFFYSKSETFSMLLELAFDSYFVAVAGYGIFNVIHRYFPEDRRSNGNGGNHNGIERRKKRNGHRFILYWWLNFLVMLFATIFFNYSGDLSGPMGTSLKIASSSTAIAIGYWVAKKKLNNGHP